MKKENGAIVVEATISLTAFMFAILTVIMVLDICYTQAKIGIALNATAKEISQYSYLYSLTGLNGSQEALYAEGLDSRESIDKTLSGVSTVMETISGVKEDYSNYNFDGMVQVCFIIGVVLLVVGVAMTYIGKKTEQPKLKELEEGRRQHLDKMIEEFEKK